LGNAETELASTPLLLVCYCNIRRIDGSIKRLLRRLPRKKVLRRYDRRVAADINMSLILLTLPRLNKAQTLWSAVRNVLCTHGFGGPHAYSLPPAIV
jgi:hypothetical protein